jgi:hypothetical protein
MKTKLELIKENNEIEKLLVKIFKLYKAQDDCRLPHSISFLNKDTEILSEQLSYLINDNISALTEKLIDLILDDNEVSITKSNYGVFYFNSGVLLFSDGHKSKTLISILENFRSIPFIYVNSKLKPKWYEKIYVWFYYKFKALK